MGEQHSSYLTQPSCRLSMGSPRLMEKHVFIGFPEDQKYETTSGGILLLQWVGVTAEMACCQMELIWR